MSDDEVRHEIFREELYVFAHLPNKEFQIKLEEFKKKHPELLTGKKPMPLDISGYQLRKHIRNRWGGI